MAQRTQHSLFVVRASWGAARKAVAQLQAQVVKPPSPLLGTGGISAAVRREIRISSAFPIQCLSYANHQGGSLSPTGRCLAGVI